MVRHTASPATFISLLIVNFAVYLKIYFIVKPSETDSTKTTATTTTIKGALKKIRKTDLNTFFGIILLVCCYMPYSAVYNMSFAGVGFSLNVYFAIVTLVFLDSYLNPMLYCWQDRAIRIAEK